MLRPRALADIKRGESLAVLLTDLFLLRSNAEKFRGGGATAGGTNPTAKTLFIVVAGSRTSDSFWGPYAKSERRNEFGRYLQ